MILHMDMDAFFASVEQLDHPELKGTALVVGDASGRGVVAAASYEARRYGIHSAMPMFMARQKCPHLVIMRVRKDRYKAVSRSVMAILDRYSPVVEQVSIDEAYVDAAGCDRLFGSPEHMARLIQSEIRDTLSLSCSMGVAPLKFLAKIASDMHKPAGLTVILPEQVPPIIATLPICKVPGVGKQALEHLSRLGVSTLGDIRAFKPAFLVDRMGKFGHRLAELACGRDDGQVIPNSPAKSISSERTLAADTCDREILRQQLLSQSEEVGRQLRRKGYRARTVTLKLKQADFRQITRSLTLAGPTQSSNILFQTALTLIDNLSLATPVRLIGIGASGLIDTAAPHQLSLFPETDLKDDEWEKVDTVMDRIAKRFGPKAVHRGMGTAESMIDES
ncbi:DNA polymerase IV [Desulfosarcina sp. OttesenSCG-928-A07]|nr:DNA polymerase IV [Desulfosarcina sp. OttesenSCG-928-A07]